MQIRSGKPIELLVFETAAGRNQINDWLASLHGSSLEKAVKGRIERIRRGNLGDAKRFRFVSRRNPVLLELRINVRSGPRLYAVPMGDGRLVLLSGGTKRRQKSDLSNAAALHRACCEQRGRLRSLRVA